MIRKPLDLFPSQRVAFWVSITWQCRRFLAQYGYFRLDHFGPTSMPEYVRVLRFQPARCVIFPKPLQTTFRHVNWPNKSLCGCCLSASQAFPHICKVNGFTSQLLAPNTATTRQVWLTLDAELDDATRPACVGPAQGKSHPYIPFPLPKVLPVVILLI